MRHLAVIEGKMASKNTISLCNRINSSKNRRLKVEGIGLSDRISSLRQSASAVLEVPTLDIGNMLQKPFQF